MTSRAARTVGRLRGARRPLTLVDQLMSSLSNVLAVVLVARVLGPDDFGRFALAYTVLTVTLTMSRSYFGTRIALSPGDAAARETTLGVVAALALLAPLVALGVLGVSAVAAGGGSVPVLVLVACTAPVVLVQDAVRFGASAVGRPQVALASDGVWVLVMGLPLALRLDLSATGALAVWGTAALLALAVALVGFRAVPRVRPGLGELRRRDPVGTSLAAGSLGTAVATLVVLSVAAHVIGSAAAGSLRGASTAMGPVNVLLAFNALALTPVLVRRERSRDLPFCAAVAATLGLLTVAWGAVLLLLPEAAGSALFGQSWDGIRAVLPWTLLEYVAIVVGAAAVLGHKVRRRSRAIVLQRSTAAVLTLAAGITAAVLTEDPRRVALGLAVSAAAAATLGWLQLARGGPGARDGVRALAPAADA